jgi:hypothetical protein
MMIWDFWFKELVVSSLCEMKFMNPKKENPKINKAEGPEVTYEV